MKHIRWMGPALALWLGGCTSVTGLIDAGDKFGCPLEGGVQCRRLSEVHEGLHAGPPADPARTPSSPRAPDTIVERMGPTQPVPDATPAAIDSTPSVPDVKRRAEEVVVLTLLPYVDAEGDLHETSRVWMRTHDAGWNIERIRREAVRRASER